MGNAEQQIEQEIQEKGLNAPRLTPDYIDNQIVSEIYITGYDAINAAMNSGTGLIKSQYQEGVDLLAPAETLTFCILIMKNGFTVTGESACASPENFNASIGRKIAYDNARNKIWQLEGYLLKQQIHHEAKLKEYFAEQGVNKDAVFVGIDLASAESLEEQLPTADLASGAISTMHVSANISKNASNGEPPIAVNAKSSGSVNGAQSCSGNVSYGNTNHHNIELLLEILRTTNVGGDVTDKARAKLSELVDKI